MLRLILPALFLAYLCEAQDHHQLKIAEKLAIPHHIRHTYDYPLLNLGAQPARPAVNQGAGFQSSGFSQPDPFNQPQRATTSFDRQPDPFNQPQRETTSFDRQPLRSVSSGSNQPVRQTRFFNLYTPGNGPDFSLNRRQS